MITNSSVPSVEPEAREQIYYQSPDVQQYHQEYVSYDLHVHTSRSDGVPSPQAVVEKAVAAGIGVAITDHNEISGSLTAYEMQACPVIPAIEVASQQGVDTLVYFNTPEELSAFYKNCVAGHVGIDPSSFTDLDVIEILKMGRAYGGFIVIAHPFGPAWKNWDRIIEKHEKEIRDLIDGIECLNGSISQRRNYQACRLAQRWGKPMVGGSDAHTLNTLGNVVTLVRNRWIAEPLTALRVGETTVVGTHSPVHLRAIEHACILAKHANYWPAIIADKFLGGSS